MARTEVAVVPSLYEGFSLPAVEHMASGTPLVASKTGALPEVVGDGAMLVGPGDPEDLAAALRRLQDSPAERERLSAAALERVRQRFAWSAVAQATVAEYRRAISQLPPGRAQPPAGPTLGADGLATAGAAGADR
jgi:glycosyltransferase involved in cell wall biosynthesis